MTPVSNDPGLTAREKLALASTDEHLADKIEAECETILQLCIYDREAEIPLHVGAIRSHAGLLRGRAKYMPAIRSQSPEPSSSEVRVKPLEWNGDEAATPFGKYRVCRTDDGYELSFEYDELVHIGFGTIEPFQDPREELRGRAQADYRARILSTLSPTVSQPVTGEEVEWKTEASGLEVATIQHDDFSLLEVCKSRSPRHAFHLTIHRGSEDKGAWDDLSIDLTEGEALKLAAAVSDYQALKAERDELAKERDRCHARLEIDHVWVLGDNDDSDLERLDIPLDKRLIQIDGIECRDATIAVLEQDLDALRARLSAVEGTNAARDVLAERRRQVEAEGWTPEHDDQHDAGEMAAAAVCYAFTAVKSPHPNLNQIWPWSLSWWKPTDKRRNLVKAGALILAEIERLDREALTTITGGENEG